MVRSGLDLSLLKLHLLVIESLAIQHFDRGIVYPSKKPVSDRPSIKTAPERFASLFERRILRRGLSRCSIERACLRVHHESRLRLHAELRTHASAFFDDVHGKIRSGESEFWWRTINERNCNPNRFRAAWVE